MALKPLEECVLYTFIDDAYLHGRSVENLATALCEGGSDIIQIRAKSQPETVVEDWVGRIKPITDKYGVSLVVNDHPSVAERHRAAFCHLGQEDFFDAGGTSAASVFSNPTAGTRMGLSTHAPDQAARAVQAGAAYLGVGPVFATGTKPGAKPVTLDYVRWASTHVCIPWFAIGGVNQANLKEVLEAGASRVCVVSAILNAQDVSGACQEFKRQLTSKTK